MANFEALKAKYQAVIDYGKTRGVSWKNVHLDHERLLLRGTAPNDAIKNEVWDRIKQIDRAYPDLAADISIDPGLPVPSTTYVVQRGDTLSRIAREFYGDAGQYMKIFDANKDKLSDPDKIRVGQELVIPP